MSTKTTIFFTGATGYIGGAILTRLLKHPKASTFDITVLLRSAEKAPIIESFGVKTLLGSNSDLDKLEKQASESDIVIAAADADDLPATQAILRGLKSGHQRTGKVPILIHTSGTGLLHDRANGMFEGETVYSDADPDQIESLAPTQLHRNVDLEIVAADKEGYAKTYIVLPSTIYGIATGPLVEAGFTKPTSQQIPNLIKAGLARGQGGMVGLGKNVWPNVHIHEVADLYIILLDAIFAGTADHGRNGFYFGENGQHKLYDVCKAISEALVAVGKGKSPEPTTFTDEECKKYFGGSFLGVNSRCRADHSRSIGWKPVKTTADLIASIPAEVEYFVQKTQ